MNGGQAMEPSQATSHGKHKGRVLRLLTYLGCLSLLSAGFLLHQARAELGERALSVGRELSRSKGVHHGTTELRLNGAAMALNSSSSELPVAEVLARFAELCRKGAPDLHAELAQAERQGARLPPADSFGILRTVPSEAEGTAACFVREKRDGMRGLVVDLEQATLSGDLSKLGQLRYVYAQRSTRGEGTHVITVWSRGSLRPEAMFPAQGDAPGRDLVEGVRPDDATRLLSAEGEGQKFQAVFYETRHPPKAVLQGYDRGLRSHGYQALMAQIMTDTVPVATRVYRKDDEDELVVLADRRGDKTRVYSFRLGTRGNVRLTQ